MTTPPSLPKSITNLIEVARIARSHAYAPYSHFAVGAAVQLSDGSTFSAANMENASYGLSLCAEAIAIAIASAAGRLADITAIALTGGPQQENSAPEKIITPCGRCRQIIAEAQQVAASPITIYCAQPKGTAWVAYSLDDLLPHAFVMASENMNVEGN
jgi:cytidine deaminase